jgi:hypothetical protein
VDCLGFKLSCSRMAVEELALIELSHYGPKMGQS